MHGNAFETQSQSERNAVICVGPVLCIDIISYHIILFIMHLCILYLYCTILIVITIMYVFVSPLYTIVYYNGAIAQLYFPLFFPIFF